MDNATDMLDSIESVTDETIAVDSVAEPSKSVKKQKKNVKECEVIYWNSNDKNFAFKYENKNIQIVLKEPIKECVSTVKVKFENGTYEIM